MAFNRCVVVNDTQENLETIGDAGRSYVGADAASALTPVLQQLVDNPDLVASLGGAAGRRARQFYTWEGVTDAYEQLFYRMCGLAARPPATDQ